jgi:hypothetical protein
MVCDHCLLIGYANQTREIDADTVRRAVEYLEEGAAPAGWKQLLGPGRPTMARYSRRAVAWSATAVAAVAAAVAVLSLGAYRPAFTAVPTTVVAAVGGVVRWLTHWWGS